jgi:hypothetical protein
MFPEYQDHLAYITSADARSAYEYLVNAAIESGVFDLKPARHGYMKNVTFFDGTQRPYAIVPAKEWILFYLRAPRKTHPGLTLDTLRQQFTEAGPGQREEFKLKLVSIIDAQMAAELIGIAPHRSLAEFQSPDEVDSAADLWEGHVRSVTVNAYERNREARRKCIAHHGLSCAVCGMNFESIYGAIGSGYIHVHHLVGIASIGKQYAVDPIRDLRPVCANCHAMLHTSNPPLSIEDLQRSLTPRSSGAPTAGHQGPA